ncbi:DUF5017 domain-containing protein [Niabella sp. CC-SYL272]|uniref:DUF5017 domain-containing protein n=1 Tax=Niabella agricola TaxID=2891571 RepID=UPI001F1DEC17|nr:DUF5017 domain-containing protein [Niabella agricola]MCF3111253.1 DUF5017 domain-containing protein [Niabella agricola]
MTTKNIYFFSSLALLIACAACQKERTAGVPENFSVETADFQYKVGDTVAFNLIGNPDMIVFYSGEPGKQYENRDRVSEKGIAKMIFQLSMQQGVPLTEVSPDSLQLFVSDQLDDYNAAAVQKASWTNITSRNTKWPPNLGTGFTTSDSIDLTDFNDADKVTIALRVKNNGSVNYSQRKWVMQNLTITNRLNDGTVTPVIANFNDAGWVQVSLGNQSHPGTADNGHIGYNVWNVGGWNQSASSAVYNDQGIQIRNAYPLTFDPGPDVNNEANDDWLISSPVDLKKVKRDAAAAVIKNIVNTPLQSYSYIYRAPGTYTASFVGINAAGDQSNEAVRQVTITVVP